MKLSRAQVFTSAFLVMVMAAVSLGSMAIGRSIARGARPIITYASEAPASWVVVDTDGVNGRSKPGFAGEVVYTFALGDILSATGRIAEVQDDSWREVAGPRGNTVWVRTEFLSKVDSKPVTPPVAPPPSTAPPGTTPPATTPPGSKPPVVKPPTPVFDDEPAGLWDVKGISTGAFLNVRVGPGTTHAIVARFAAGSSEIHSTGRIARVDGALWRQVEYRDDARGWVNAAFLERHVVPAPVPVFGTESPGRWDVTGLTAGSSLNVRSGPGTTNEIIARLAANAVGIPSTGKNATVDGSLWREVEYGSGKKGWVSARHLIVHVTVPPVAGPVFTVEARGLWDVDAIATGKSLEVRSYPGASGTVIGRLASDATGIASTGKTAIIGDVLWRQVQHTADATGWVVADRLVVTILPEDFQEVIDAFFAARIAGHGAEAYLAKSAAKDIAKEYELNLYGSYTLVEAVKARHEVDDKWELDIRVVDESGTEVFETLRFALKKTGEIQVVRMWITQEVA